MKDVSEFDSLHRILSADYSELQHPPVTHTSAPPSPPAHIATRPQIAGPGAPSHLRPPGPPERSPACMRAPARAQAAMRATSTGTEPLLGLCHSRSNMHAPLLTSCIALIKTEDQMSAIPNNYAAEIAGRFVHPI